MSLVLVVLLGVLAIGVSNRNPVHPATASLLLQTEPEAIDCQPSGPSEFEKPNRVSHFRVSGEFDCRRPIFTREERDPVFDRAFEAAVADSLRVAEIVRAKLVGKDISIVVTITGDYPADVRETIASVYRNELLSSLGPGRLVRNASTETAELSVDLQRADHSDLVAHARLRIPSGQKNEGASWQNL